MTTLGSPELPNSPYDTPRQMPTASPEEIAAENNFDDMRFLMEVVPGGVEVTEEIMATAAVRSVLTGDLVDVESPQGSHRSAQTGHITSHP